MNAKKVTLFRCEVCRCTADRKEIADKCCQCATKGCNSAAKYYGYLPNMSAGLCASCRNPLRVKELLAQGVAIREELAQLRSGG